MKKRGIILAPIAGLLLITGCNKADNSSSIPQSEIVAQVGSEVLTSTMIESITDKSLTDEQKIDFVQKWLDRELLYQEAVRNRYDKNNDVSATLSEMRRNYLSVAYLDNLLKDNKHEEVSEDEIKSFFNKNRDRFVRQEDVIRYSSIAVDRVKFAWDVKKLLSKSNFHRNAKRYSLESVVAEPDAPFIKKASKVSPSKSA